MGVPVIPHSDLEYLLGQAQSGFSKYTHDPIKETVRKGVYTMEYLLNSDSEDSYRREVIRYWRENEFIPSKAKWWENVIIAILYLAGFLSLIVPFILFLFVVPLIEAFRPASIVRSDWYRDFRERIEVFIDIVVDIYHTLIHSMQVPQWATILIFVAAFIFILIILYQMMVLPMKLRARKYRKASFEAAEEMNAWELFEYSNNKTYCKFDLTKSLTSLCDELDIDPEQFKIDLGEVSGGGSTYYGWGSGSAIGAGILLSAMSQGSAAAKNKEINDRLREIESYVFYNYLATFYNTHLLADLDDSAELAQSAALPDLAVTAASTAPAVSTASPEPAAASVDAIIENLYGIESSSKKSTKGKTQSYKVLAWTAFGLYTIFFVMLCLFLAYLSQSSINDIFLGIIGGSGVLAFVLCIIFGIMAIVKRKKHRVKPAEKSKFNVFLVLTIVIPIGVPIFAILSAIDERYSSLSKHIAWWITVTQFAFWSMVIIAGVMQ